MTAPPRESVRAVVEASPAAVAAHDKGAWTALFAADGEVHDPVGARPQRDPAAIARFYDMFIAPNTIVFDVEHDVIAGDTMIRDLTVYTTMSTGVTMRIPMHLRYEVTLDDAGRARILGLYAHWELRGMIAQLLAAGPRGLLAGTILGPRLVRTLGPRAAAGFLAGLRGVGAGGRRRARAALRRRGLSVGKTLAAGTSVTVTVHDGDRRGLALVEFGGVPGDPAITLYFGEG
ncbi:nuclear transport factor 2 family protein [Tsukamurella sp. 1534]|uniref:nuclear transport factor 2 family protein n=1 Tax=Tsukamurella sp. 1534 TaxID=1151061 RepID=UPI00059342EA|nr:nuclear transport factor 2 family protein [Tsukamurella sp. 1534]